MKSKDDTGNEKSSYNQDRSFVLVEDQNNQRTFSKRFDSDALKKISTALFYASASIMIIFSNKIVLTKYK